MRTEEHSGLAVATDYGEVRTSPRRACYLCGSPGDALYERAKDFRYGCPGAWTVRKCSRKVCGLLWLDPMPAEEDTPFLYGYFRETHGETAPSPERRPTPTQRVKRAYLALRCGCPLPEGCARSERWLGLLGYVYPTRANAHFPFVQLCDRPPGRLLDVGCGSGEMMSSMRDWGWQVEGIDFDPLALESARRKGLSVQQGSFTRTEFPDGCFDAVIMSHVIEHVHDPIAFLTRAFRLLRAGGRVVIATPNARSLGHKWWKQYWVSLATPYHLFLFDRNSLENALREAGFSEIRCSTSTHWADQSFIASRVIRGTGAWEYRAAQSRALRLYGLTMSHLEWLGLRLFSDLGEELVAVGIK